MNNLDIRMAIKKARLFAYEVAEAMGITETYFSRKLRKELPPEEKQRILAVIDRLAQEKRGVT